MIYVIDTSSLSVLKYYYKGVFSTFWGHFNLLVQSGNLISVREAYKEADEKIDSEHLQEWLENNKSIFLPPESPEETEFVREIFVVPHFKALIPDKKILTSNPLADPFIVASAKIRNGCVITEEKLKPNAAKIPNVCEHFGVRWTNLEGLMKEEKWNY